MAPAVNTVQHHHHLGLGSSVYVTLLTLWFQTVESGKAQPVGLDWSKARGRLSLVPVVITLLLLPELSSNNTLIKGKLEMAAIVSTRGGYWLFVCEQCLRLWLQAT